MRELMVRHRTLCKAARSLLGWSAKDLARFAGVGTSTVADFERGARATEIAILDKIVAAFLREGVEFEKAGEALHVHWYRDPRTRF